MPRNRWKARRWWRDNVFSPPFSGSGRWKNTWPDKRRKKRAAWQAAFDYLPDLDQYETLSSALPLIGITNHEMTRDNGNCFCTVLLNFLLVECVW